MNAIAINASPRKDKNTAKMLQSALDGARENGATTTMIHLKDLDFSGCKSCFACKRVGNNTPGECKMKDDLSEILLKVRQADMLFLGSPFYAQSVTGDMRNFLERLFFPNLEYKPGYPSLFEGKLQVGFIYTMNVTKEQLEANQYPYMQAEMDKNAYYLERLFHSCHTICAYDTCQFDDYSKYVAPLFDEKHKKEVQETLFPIYLNEAYELGKKFALEKNKSSLKKRNDT